MARTALIVYGGWEGHFPQKVAEKSADLLREEGFDVEIFDNLEPFLDEARLKALSLIVPAFSMGKITEPQLKSVRSAIESGVGLAGNHGGMCDAFREATDWQWITGGQWVAHPGNQIRHRIRIIKGSHPIVDGIEDFEINSEQYLMHVDPSNRVLATTEFPLAEGPHTSNGTFDMPVIWTRRFGAGKVFFNSIGHEPELFDTEVMRSLTRRGFNWASRES